MRSTKITSVTRNPKSRPSLGLFKDSADDKIKVFDERGFVEELGGLQGPPGPQGNQGTQGEPGPVGPAGLTWRGSWASGTSYILNDAVGYNGASYFCIQATSGTSNPSVATTNWALLASQGARGPQGIQGVPGPQGNTGPAGTSTSAAGLVASGSVIVPINETVNFATTTLFTGAIDSRSGRIDVTFGSGNSIQPGAFAQILIFNSTVTLNSIVLLTPRFANSANTSIDTISIVSTQNGTFTLEVKAGSNANFNGFSINFAVINP